jgi:KDO2-lipid IV(A) lauroyltransferase
MRRRAARAGKIGRRVSLVAITKTVALVARILPYKLAVAAGAVLGYLSFALIRRDRERAMAHLALAFPERPAEWVSQTARRCFMHLGRSLVEALVMDRRRLDAVVEFRGQDKIAEALRGGKGAVFITGHIGNWEVMADAVAVRFPLSVVAAPLEPEAINDMIVRLRDRMGIKTIVRGKQGAVKELIRSFKENRILGLLIDQDTDVDGAFVNFFGRPAWTPTAAAQMAIKFGAPVVFGYIHRENSGHHCIEIDGPLEIVRTGNDAEDIIQNTALFTKRIEEAVMRHPEQWVWMHRRWRRQP